MDLQGGCYCGALRYRVTAEPVFKGECHCRECQYISGGGPNFFMIVPPGGFEYTVGSPSAFARSDLEAPVTREFCGTCGTHIATWRPGVDGPILKIGTLDDPAQFGGPQAAIYMVDCQPFHVLPEGLPTFEYLPQR
ncbi:hypothetical protein DLJ53_26615 [Acuticoccus sediminis]|uniref:CENP-V/GFA domain-containing protein n=1 Tax=Acuticoccus sediminis TaxID=2184697 RepID=A0A8B2NK61_9HYPH|nr:GFA family protein [Acuticoccus sediminis]RAH98284.1 hypothetical protein DLJ53_26615 [Acuticoccus sediminis]